MAQDFWNIKRECLEAGVLFEDPDFIADTSSIWLHDRMDERCKWMRPKELCADPKFFVSGASRFDVQQGELGDCWLLAAVASLTQHEKLFHHIVIPEHNSFGSDYCGAFHFRFWQYGTWVDVVVDDRLPTKGGELVYMRSGKTKEFWSVLLEKAYAKLHGSYEALEGGTTCEALEDLTGGITEMYEVQHGAQNLFKIMESAFARSSLMGCSFNEETHGLVTCHAYSITSVKTVDTLDMDAPDFRRKVQLVRIRNPWGNSAEWYGEWSERSKEWTLISDDVKKGLGLTSDYDGEFWMSFEEFTKYWDWLEICHLSAGWYSGECETDKGACRWVENRYEGIWIPGATAGGSRQYLETFASNHQYILKLDPHDKNDPNQKCTILIALIQKNRRAQRKLGKDCLTIGFAIYALPDSDNLSKPLTTQFFKDNASVGRCYTFLNLREISSRFVLSPGRYVIVPSTFEPNQEGEFMLRVFTETEAEMSEYDGKVGVTDVNVRVKDTVGNEDDHKKWVSDLFKTVAGDDGEIDWRELMKIIDLSLVVKNDYDHKGVPTSVCRSMVALMDRDMTGKLGLDETIKLAKSIQIWKNAFKLYDEDSSGYLVAFELRKALESAGYQVNNKILEGITVRYGNDDGKIHFYDFLLCGVKLMAMNDFFNQRSEDDGKKATFSLEEWIQTTIYS